MKRVIPIIMMIMICFFSVSCGTSRFTFDRTEKNIKELGGTYSKEVGEEISKIYKNGGIEEVIDTVYQTDYTGGDPYVVVEGYLGEEAYEDAQTITGSGNITIVRGIIRNNIPILSKIPVVGPLFFSQTYWTTWLCLIVWGVSYFLLYKTNFGLRLRACGEHPSAVASAGVNVHKMRYIGVLLSGMLSGLGGAVILVTYAGEYNSGAGINGLGFLAIAALIFGQWKPLGILGSTAFFGLFMTIANTGRVIPGIASIPTGFLGLFPYLATLIALILSSKKSRAPLASGQPF